MDCLREIPYLRRSVLCWLVQVKFGLSTEKFNRELYRLLYLGKLTIPDDAADCIALNRQVHRDFVLLTAADIMREICGDSLPEFVRSTLPCVLSFYLRDRRGYLDFKVVPVPPGSEQLVLEQLRHTYPGFKCTWLFLPERPEQMEQLHTENPACFVFRNKVGGYDFLRKR